MMMMMSRVQTMKYLTLTPAYGRDYKSKKEAIADFDANKDFVLQTFDGSGYINKSQILAEFPGATVNIRYKRLTQIAVVKLSEKKGKK